MAGSLAQLVRMIGLLLGAAVLAAIPPMLGIPDTAAFATKVQASFGVAAVGLAAVLLLGIARWRQLWFPGAAERQPGSDR